MPVRAKQPFDIGKAVPLLREAVVPYPKTALFELAADGHASVVIAFLARPVQGTTGVAVLAPGGHPVRRARGRDERAGRVRASLRAVPLRRHPVRRLFEAKPVRSAA